MVWNRGNATIAERCQNLSILEHGCSQTSCGCSQKVHPFGQVHCSIQNAKFLLVACCSQGFPGNRHFVKPAELNSFVILGVLPALAQSAGQSWPTPVRDNEIRYYVIFNQLEARVTGPQPTF